MADREILYLKNRIQQEHNKRVDLVDWDIISRMKERISELLKQEEMYRGQL